MHRVLATFTRSERYLLTFILTVIATGYGVRHWQTHNQSLTVFSTRDTVAPTSRRPAVPEGLDRASGKVDLNLASREVLQTLPGVGPVMAEAIEQHRNQHGPFRSMTDLDNVPGVGPSMLQKLSSRVTFGDAGAAPVQVSTAPAVPVPVAQLATQFAPQQPSAEQGKININTATAEQLETLKGVGPALARRIVEDRQRHGPFTTAESLKRVRGIGAKVYQDNRHRLVVQ